MPTNDKEYQKKYMHEHNTSTDCVVCGGRYKKYLWKVHFESLKHKRKVAEADSQNTQKSNIRAMFHTMAQHIRHLEEELQCSREQ